MKSVMKKIFFLIVIMTIAACARKGNPTGGPKDVDPPKFISAFPDTLSTNVDVNTKEIIINFDEYILLKEYSKNVVISPPFQKNAIVTPQATAKRNISIKLQEPLQPNTTYNFNFGSSVRDNNEGNIYPNFSYVFSTGDYIDSLEVSGKVKDPYNVKQSSKILIGLYKMDEAYKDSLILRQKPYYITRAKEDGTYEMKYLAAGKYKVIAFADEVENTMYDFGKEQIAFQNEPLVLDKNENINLKLFLQKPNYRVAKSEQKGYGQILFKTEGLLDSLKIKSLSKNFTTSVVEQFPDKDSIVFWFNPKVDTLDNKSQRLKFAVEAKQKTDTVTVSYINPKDEFKFSLKTDISSNGLAPNQRLKLVGNSPIVSWNKEDIELFRDSVQIPFEVSKNPKNINELFIDFEKDYEQKFEINLYPNAVQNIFGLTNDTIANKFVTGKTMDYGNLKLTIANPPTKPFILQFIKKDKDQILEEFYGQETVYEFKNLDPTEYYFRVLVDENENKKWDSGNFLEGIQPEPVYLYPATITIRKMWDANETWILGQEPKPEETKNATDKTIPNLREERGK